MKVPLQKKHTILLGGSAILLPIIIMTVCYYLIGIYPGSERSLLASDALVQYASFHANLHNVLHGEQSLFYTWQASLGLNYWAFAGYYLNGLFSPLVYFFDNASMPDTLYFLTLLKFGAMGGSFWWFARKTYRLSEWLYLGLSISYALMAYATAYSEVIMWLDSFVYLPLIFLGIHRVMDEGRPGLLFVSYLLLFLSSFYMGFMIGVFSFLYVLCRTLTNRQRYVSRIPRYLLASVLAGGASMVTILPTLLDLKNNGEGLSSIYTLLQPDMGPWDLLAKSMVGVYDTSKYGAAPFIYVGLLPLICCLWYFVTNKIPIRNKILYGSLFLLLIASIYIYPLNLFWHGFHTPNMFLFRFSFLFSFLVLLLAGYGLETINRAAVDRMSTLVIVVLLAFLGMYFLADRKRYDYVSAQALIVTLVLLLVYLGLIILSQREKRTSLILGLIFLSMLSEAGFNSYTMIEGINGDWTYPARKAYTDGFQEVQALVEQAEKANDDFYRLESLDGRPNDSLKFGYSGVTLFSSIRNRHSSQYLNQLGFRSNGTNLMIRYANNTLVMDALVGIKYNLSKQPVNKFGFEKVGQSGEYSLYENRYALPLGILTDKGIYEKDAVANQNQLVQYLSGKETALFSITDAEQIELENSVMKQAGGQVAYIQENAAEDQRVTWEVTVPAEKQAYLSLVATEVSKRNEVDITLTVNGVTRTKELIGDGQYYDLGYYEQEETVTVSAVMKKEEGVSAHMYQPDVLLLDIPTFEEMMKEIKKNSVAFQVDGRTAEATVDLKEDQVILTTIPYDRGWKAFIDGEEVKIPTFKEALLTLPVEKGKHTINFVFFPQGLKVGLGLFFSCNGLFIFYLFYLSRQRRKEEGRNNEKIK